MPWAYNQAEEAYILIASDCHCSVRQSTSGVWTAVVSCRWHSSAAHSFATLADGQAWCAEQVTKLTTRQTDQ